MRRRHRRRPGDSAISVINITNLVDVTLVTLIIYMLLAPLVEQGIDVRLPRSSPQRLTVENPVTVSVSRRGDVFLDSLKVTKPQLRDRLSTLARAKPDIAVVVRGDDDLAYGEVIAVLDIARGSGVTNVGLATRAER